MARVASIKNKFGRLIGWNNVTVVLFGRELEGITDIEYDDEYDDKLAYGAGEEVIGIESGNYTPKVGVTFYAEEIFAIQSKLPPGENLRSIPQFAIIVEYEYNGVIMKDVIQATFKGNARSLKQGEGKTMVKPPMLCIGISWNAA